MSGLMGRRPTGESSSLGSRSEFNAPVLPRKKLTVRPVVGQTTDLGQLGRVMSVNRK